jgi:hypothetical protein
MRCLLDKVTARFAAQGLLKLGQDQPSRSAWQPCNETYWRHTATPSCHKCSHRSRLLLFGRKRGRGSQIYGCPVH